MWSAVSISRSFRFNRSCRKGEESTSIASAVGNASCSTLRILRTAEWCAVGKSYSAIAPTRCPARNVCKQQSSRPITSRSVIRNFRDAARSNLEKMASFEYSEDFFSPKLDNRPDRISAVGWKWTSFAGIASRIQRFSVESRMRRFSTESKQVKALPVTESS